MSLYLNIHPTHPQARLIKAVAEILAKDGLIVLPTDTTYVLACNIRAKEAIARLRHIRQVEVNHPFTLLCSDLSMVSDYARLDNAQFKILKQQFPGPYTFILNATKGSPHYILTKQKTVGIRISAHVICQNVLEFFHEPLVVSTLRLPDMSLPFHDPERIQEKLGRQVDCIVDGGIGGMIGTTVMDLSADPIRIVREGAGRLF